MTDLASLRIIAAWLSNLADLCRHGAEGRPTKNAIAAYSTMLGKDFPSGAFTSDSLHAAVQGENWFPSYNTVRERLAAWWRDHGPDGTRAITGPAGDGAAELNGADLEWFAFFRMREAEFFGPITIGKQRWAASSRRHVLSLVKQKALPAWKVLTKSDIGEAQRWPDATELQRRPGDDDDAARHARHVACAPEAVQ